MLDKLPHKISPIICTSVDIRNSKITANSSLDFKNLPENLQINMHEKVTEMLKNRANRFRSKPKDRMYNLNSNRRQNIALRILSKLQDWPSTEQKTGKSFKKFYWTKDYSF